MKRRAAGWAVVQLAVAAGAGPLGAQGLPARALTPRVTIVRAGAGANVLVRRGAEGAALVDAGEAGNRDSLAATLDSLGVTQVRFVIDTHYHYDHIGGNGWLAARGATTVAHSAVPALALVDTTIAELAWHREAAAPENLPMLTVGDSASLRVPARMEMFHVPAAHTASDLVVWLPDDDVIHTGDVYEVGAYPFLDLWAGGSIGGMIRAVHRVLALVGASTWIVPGHGEPGHRGDLERYGAMLTAVCRAVRDMPRGRSVEQVMDAAPTAQFDGAYGSARGGRRFAALVYWSLERGSDCG